jgi:SAM-dependent methyltransferase
MGHPGQVMTATEYVHGYSEYEARRLGEQADILADLLHADTAYPAGSRVLEVGCGVGAQTVHLVAASPAARVVAVDISASSLAQAAPGWQPRNGGQRGMASRRPVELPFADAAFDHLFVCFVPSTCRTRCGRWPGFAGATAGRHHHGDRGAITGRLLPPRQRARLGGVDCLVRLQVAAGQRLLGRQLQPLPQAGYHDVVVRPMRSMPTRPGQTWSAASP